MARPSQGNAVPKRPRDPEQAWYAWKYYHPRESEDAHTAWHAAWKQGGQAMLVESGQIAGFLPLLADLLMRWMDLEVEDEIIATDRRSA